MDRNISDEQLDRITATLLADFAADEETVAAIADSPKLWWSVRSAIATEQARRERGWFAFLRPRLVSFAACALLLVGGLATFVMLRGDRTVATAVDNVAPSVKKVVTTNEVDASAETSGVAETAPKAVVERATSPVAKKTLKARPVVSAERVAATKVVKVPDAGATAKVEETKTDFIALSYAGAADGGQIVRVKVPSAMMVSLGVATNVEKQTEFVSAEIVVGDDGLARAIRFIR